MTFWEAIYDLRQRKLIPREWSASDILAHLHHDFSLNTIRTVPANQSISKDGNVEGDYVKKGREPKAFRLGNGLYELINDPEK